MCGSVGDGDENADEDTTKKPAKKPARKRPAPKPKQKSAATEKNAGDADQPEQAATKQGEGVKKEPTTAAAPKAKARRNAGSGGRGSGGRGSGGRGGGRGLARAPPKQNEFAQAEHGGMLESEDADTFTQCAIDEDREETLLIDYGTADACV